MKNEPAIIIFTIFLVVAVGFIIGVVSTSNYVVFNKIDSFQYSEANADEMILLVQKIKAKEDFSWIGDMQGSASSLESNFYFQKYSLVFDDVQIRAKSFRDYRKYWKFVKELFEKDMVKVEIDLLLKDYNK